LSWVRSISDDKHLGQEIISQAPHLDFFPFFITRPILKEFFVRILIEDEQPIEGYVGAMEIDPENNLFSIQILQGHSSKFSHRDFALDKLKSFEQLSTNMDILSRAEAMIKFSSQVSIAKNQPSSSRGSKWNSNLTAIRYLFR